MQDTWELDLISLTWTDILSSLKTLSHNALIYEDKMFMFGGTYSTHSNELYVFNLNNNQWNNSFTDLSPNECSASFAFARRCFSCCSTVTTPLNDLWMLDLKMPKWTLLNPTGDIPSKRCVIQNNG